VHHYTSIANSIIFVFIKVRVGSYGNLSVEPLEIAVSGILYRLDVRPTANWPLNSTEGKALLRKQQRAILLKNLNNRKTVKQQNIRHATMS